MHRVHGVDERLGSFSVKKTKPLRGMEQLSYFARGAKRKNLEKLSVLRALSNNWESQDLICIKLRDLFMTALEVIRKEGVRTKKYWNGVLNNPSQNTCKDCGALVALCPQFNLFVECGEIVLASLDRCSSCKASITEKIRAKAMETASALLSIWKAESYPYLVANKEGHSKASKWGELEGSGCVP